MDILSFTETTNILETGYFVGPLFTAGFEPSPASRTLKHTIVFIASEVG